MLVRDEADVWIRLCCLSVFLKRHSLYIEVIILPASQDRPGVTDLLYVVIPDTTIFARVLLPFPRITLQYQRPLW